MYNILIDDFKELKGILCPLYIISKDLEPINLMIGKAENEGSYSIWIEDEDYHKINHENVYVFIHCNKEVIEVEKEKIKEMIKHQKTEELHHVHIEYSLNTKKEV